MVKYPLSWHEKNLENSEAYLQRAEVYLREKEQQVRKLNDNVMFQRMQVERAKKEGITEYDPDKYNHKRKSKI